MGRDHQPSAEPATWTDTTCLKSFYLYVNGEDLSMKQSPAFEINTMRAASEGEVLCVLHWDFCFDLASEQLNSGSFLLI